MNQVINFIRENMHEPCVKACRANVEFDRKAETVRCRCCGVNNVNEADESLIRQAENMRKPCVKACRANVEFDQVSKPCMEAYLVGFSGGYDSMALLDYLNKNCDFKLIALHLNHNWRPIEAKAEEENCRRFCEERNIEFVSKTLCDDVLKTETAAREERQKFFKEYYEKYNADGLFLAHTKSDNAETLIYRVIQGTGVLGLCAIAPHNEINGMKIYRPLINVSRNEIEEYCKENNLSPNNDTSNENTEYKRNFIRHKILPLFKEINPDYEENITRLSTIATDEQRIIQEYMKMLEKDLKDGSKYKTDKFFKLSKELQMKFILDFLRTGNFEYDSKKAAHILEFLSENKNSKTGKTYSLNAECCLFINNKYFYQIQNGQNSSKVQNQDETDSEVLITGEGCYEFKGYTCEIKKYSGPEIAEFPKETEYCAYISNLSFPLTLRKRCDGDTIRPFGMQGTMKLKKFLINKNVPKYERDSIIMLARNNEILWAAGYGLSENLRADKIPEYVIRIGK